MRGFYAVKFNDTPEIRITGKRVDTALEALDDVLGTHFSVPKPMRIDVLHDFGNVRVKCVATTVADLRSSKKLAARIADTTGWEQPRYAPELVARVRRSLRAAGIELNPDVVLEMRMPVGLVAAGGVGVGGEEWS